LTLQFFHPDLGPAKGILVCYVVYYNRSLCPSAKDIFRYSNAGHFGLQ
jgi:hypothetical protein